MTQPLIIFFFISFYILNSWYEEYLLVKTMGDDYSPYFYEQLRKQAIGDRAIVIMLKGMVLGFSAAGDAGTENGETTIASLYRNIKFIKNQVVIFA